MKLTNMVVGLVAFSVIVSMFFLTAADILEKNFYDFNNTDTRHQTFEALGGEYYGLSTDVSDKGSTIKDIEEASQAGAGVKTDEPDVSALKGALSGGKLAINFYTNFQNIINNATADINQDMGVGDTYIHPNIKNGILAAVSIILIFIVLHFVWRFKTET